MKAKDNEDQVGKETSIPKKVVFFVRRKDFLEATQHSSHFEALEYALILGSPPGC